jgi:hypothetical protein
MCRGCEPGELELVGLVELSVSEVGELPHVSVLAEVVGDEPCTA